MRALAKGLLIALCLVGCDTPPVDGLDVDLSGPPAADLGGAPTADAAMAQGCTGKQAQKAGLSTRMIKSGGATRTYLLNVPAKYDPQRPASVVLDLHGFSSNAAQQVEYSRIVPESESRGFLMVAPQGTGTVAGWNAGTCCGSAAQDMVDDVALVRGILTELRRDFCVDDGRLYAMGMSNGGFMSQRLGCDLAGELAAIGPVAGGMLLAQCKPARPISVMYFHGTADNIVPYEGGGLLGFPKAVDTFTGWAMRDGCTGAPTQTFSKGKATCQTYGACREGSEVTLCTIKDGGHTWPGSQGANMDIDATAALLDFFARHAGTR